jgi:hypothetical protein
MFRGIAKALLYQPIQTGGDFTPQLSGYFATPDCDSNALAPGEILAIRSQHRYQAKIVELRGM